MMSRNKREGRYAGKRGGKHYRGIPSNKYYECPYAAPHHVIVYLKREIQAGATLARQFAGWA